jgi:hypothetical protein
LPQNTLFNMVSRSVDIRTMTSAATIAWTAIATVQDPAFSSSAPVVLPLPARLATLLDAPVCSDVPIYSPFGPIYITASTASLAPVTGDLVSIESFSALFATTSALTSYVAPASSTLLPQVSADPHPLVQVTAMYAQVPRAQVPASYAHTRDAPVDMHGILPTVHVQSAVVPAAHALASTVLMHDLFSASTSAPTSATVTSMLYFMGSTATALSLIAPPPIVFPSPAVVPTPAFPAPHGTALYSDPAVLTNAGGVGSSPAYGSPAPAMPAFFQDSAAQSPTQPLRYVRFCCHAYGAQQLCQLCGLNGHLASHCYRTNIGENYKGRRQVTLAAQGYSPSYPVDASWCLDTGATDHLTNQVDKLTVREPYHGHDKVYTANGAGMHISHIG